MHDNHDHDHNHTHHDISGQPAGENTAQCPVMKGMMVNKEEAEKEGRVREYNGKKYYLCCDGCVADFDADPKKYAE